MEGLANMVNVHPLFVHFPIVLTLTALFFEAVGLVMQRDRARDIATALIYLGAVSAVITLFTGYGAADTLGHDTPGHDMVHGHRDVMLWYSGVFLLLAVLNGVIAWKKLAESFSLWERLARPVLLLAASGLLVYGADRGGQLVFRYGMGVRMEAVSEADQHQHDHDISTGSGQIEEPEKEAASDSEHDHSDHEHDH